MALIAVLWVVAALSLMIAALTHTVRSEIRQASHEQSRLQAIAWGDAAIYMALQRMGSSAEDRRKHATDVEVVFERLPIRVKVIPANGFIDLNNAPVGLVRLMLITAAGVQADQAQQLAEGIIAYRTSKDSSGKAFGFNAPEDLLRVPGVDYDLYAKVAPVVTADITSGGSGKVSPLAAPLPVLAILASGNMAVASAISSARDAGAQEVDVNSLDAQYIEISGQTNIYSLWAEVPSGNSSVVQAMRTVVFGSPGSSGIPWRTIRTDQRFGQIL